MKMVFIKRYYLFLKIISSIILTCRYDLSLNEKHFQVGYIIIFFYTNKT